MVAQTLDCPECNAPLEPPPGRTQFFCSFCGSTIVIPTEYQTRAETRPSEPPEDDDVLHPAPDLSKFDIDKRGDELTISFAWRSWSLLFLIPFAVFWNGVVIGMGVGVFSMDHWMFKVGYFFVPHVWIGAFLIYLIAAMFLNRTTIHVNRDWLRIVHGPLPWRTPKPVDVHELAQLYVKHSVSHSENGSSTTYQLTALMNDGSSTKLFKGHQDENTPIALERMIEVHLGIKDQAVKGEYGR